MSTNACACSAAPKLIFACSGAADVGAIADQAARKLSKEGVGRMFCLAGVGGRVSGIVKTTESAAAIRGTVCLSNRVCQNHRVRGGYPWHGLLVKPCLSEPPSPRRLSWRLTAAP
jgi:hypothetical protein